MTALWNATAIAEAVGAITGLDAAITAISIDTRTLSPGALFVALVGENGDGHDHVAHALEAGAACALVHRDIPGLDGDPRLLRVDDTLAALHALGAAGRARFTGRLVAITGSVGKTTTKEMLRTALSACGPTHAAQASYNNHWGVPLTLALMPADAAYAVIEIGMNHAGEIAPLAALARPDVALITTIAAAHIGHLGSLEAIATEKASLFGALRPGGTALFPADAPHADILEAAADAAGARIVRLGEDVRLDGVALGGSGSFATAHLTGGSVRLTLNAPGRHLADNALACLAAADALGADIDKAAAALADFTPGAGRGQMQPILGGAAWLLDESYNASSLSIRASLAVLRLLPAARRVAVLGDMLELGEFARSEHENLNPCVRESADVVYCSGAMMKHLHDSLPDSLRGGHADTAHALAPLVADGVRAGDVVLVKGSLGSRMRDVVNALRSVAA